MLQMTLVPSCAVSTPREAAAAAPPPSVLSCVPSCYRVRCRAIMRAILLAIVRSTVHVCYRACEVALARMRHLRDIIDRARANEFARCKDDPREIFVDAF